MFRLRFRLANVLKFTALCALFLAIFRWIAGDLAFQVDWPRSVLYPLAVSVLCAWSVMRRKSGSPRCQNCGRQMLPIPGDPKGGTCPACSMRRLPSRDRRRIGFAVLLVVAILIGALPFVLLRPFAGALENAWGRFAYPAISIGLFVLLFALVFGFLVLRLLVGMWRMSSPGQALLVASASARVKPTELSLGAASVFCFGTDDPTALLGDAMQVVGPRFAKRVGEPLESARPLHFFVFGKRAAFEEFVKQSLLNAGDLDGLYIPWRTRTIAITTERVLDQGPGVTTPPLAEVQDALRERLIPTILDEGAPVMNRIQAIRDMGRAGHYQGADVLIDVLGTGDKPLVEAATWALEMISGRALGPDEDSWREWWKNLEPGMVSV